MSAQLAGHDARLAYIREELNKGELLPHWLRFTLTHNPQTDADEIRMSGSVDGQELAVRQLVSLTRTPDLDQYLYAFKKCRLEMSEARRALLMEISLRAREAHAINKAGRSINNPHTQEMPQPQTSRESMAERMFLKSQEIQQQHIEAHAEFYQNKILGQSVDFTIHDDIYKKDQDMSNDFNATTIYLTDAEIDDARTGNKGIASTLLQRVQEVLPTVFALADGFTYQYSDGQPGVFQVIRTEGDTVLLRRLTATNNKPIGSVFPEEVARVQRDLSMGHCIEVTVS